MSYFFSTLEEYERISERVPAGTRAQSYFYNRPKPEPEPEPAEKEGPKRTPRLMPLRTRTYPSSRVLPIRHPPPPQMRR
jgi:hypothetical protein